MAEKQYGCGTVLLGLFIVVMFIGILDDDGADSSSSDSGPAHDDVSAYTMCQQFTEDRLKAPSTADWPWGISEDTQSLGNGKYRVRTHVDAENSFGAKIRNDIDCTVQYVGNDKWRLKNLDID